MQTLDNILAVLTRPFEKLGFTPLYRMLIRRPDNQVSDDQRQLIRLSRAVLVSCYPILVFAPISLYYSYSLFKETRKIIGNPQKYRVPMVKSGAMVLVSMGLFFLLSALYPTEMQMRVIENRKAEVQQFMRTAESGESYVPKPLRISIIQQRPGVDPEGDSTSGKA